MARLLSSGLGDDAIEHLHHEALLGLRERAQALDLLLEPWGRSALAVFVGDGHGVDIGGMGASSIAVDETHGNGAAAGTGSCGQLQSTTVSYDALGNIRNKTGVGLIHMGGPIHDMPGLTYTGSLERFWIDAPDMRIDSELFRRFRNYVIRRTQLNGSFYRRLDLPGSCSGVVWPHSAPVRVPMYPQPVAADVIVQEAV